MRECLILIEARVLTISGTNISLLKVPKQPKILKLPPTWKMILALEVGKSSMSKRVQKMTNFLAVMAKAAQFALNSQSWL